MLWQLRRLLQYPVVDRRMAVSEMGQVLVNDDDMGELSYRPVLTARLFRMTSALQM